MVNPLVKLISQFIWIILSSIRGNVSRFTEIYSIFKLGNGRLRRMHSRREFFEMSLLALTALSSQAPAQTFAEASQGPDVRRAYWNDLPDYLIRKVAAARTRRKAELAKVRTPAAASERASMVQTKVWELIGGKLERSPLNARVTGAIERSAYRIEKVVFESQPEFYVTAHLYLPKSGNPPFPGILAPLGHAPEGKAYRSYQTVFQNLARRGFVVLAFDPPGQGERLQYIHPRTGRAQYGPTGEHDRFGLPALLVGSTTTQFEVWDGIRALDYLLSRAEVDPKRIGCCGHSGGGTQTMYLCALEPRIQAAVVVEGHTENLAGADYQPPGAYADAEQNLIGSLAVPLDRGDLLWAFAPKPLLLCYTPVDAGSTYSPTYVQGTEEIFEELRAVYAIQGAEARVSLSSSPLPHDYDYFQRRATYDWFGTWLLNEHREIEESDFDDAPQPSLWCTSTGQVLTSIGGRAAFEVIRDRLRVIRTDTGTPSKEGIQDGLRELLKLPADSASFNSRSLSQRTYRNLIIEEVEYQSEPGIHVPGWFLKSSSAGPKFPVTVVVNDNGRDDIFDHWPLIESIISQGSALFSIDLRTCGITRPRLPSAGPWFYGDEIELAYAMVNLSVGVPIIGQQTHDLLRGLEYLRARSDVTPGQLGLFGTARAGLVCLLAAALDNQVRSVLVNRTLVDYESIVAAWDYKLPLSTIAFGFLEKFDLPQICSTLAPRPVWLVNTVGAQASGLALSETRERYRIAARAYQGAGQPDRLSFQVTPEPIDNLVSEWVKQALA